MAPELEKHAVVDKESLPAITARIVATYEECGAIHHLGHSPLPSYREVVDILAGFSLFADLSTPELETLVTTFEEAWFNEGERVVRQGMAGSGFLKPYLPTMNMRSEGLSGEAKTLTSTSPGPGRGTGTCATVKFPGVPS